MALRFHSAAPAAVATKKSREENLKQLATMSDETLQLLAELSTRPGVQQKLKEKYSMLKLFL